MSGPALLADWTGEDVGIGEVEAQLARLRQDSSAEGAAPHLRTSVMTHLAWVPAEWLDVARRTLAGLAERHPSRTILLVPDADADEDRIDAVASLQCFALPGVARQICSEVVELRLRGSRAKAPATVVAPLLVSDLPVFCRWRGRPPFGSPELDQLVGLADRLVVDSAEWDDLPASYAKLAPFFERTAVSDIAWARGQRWRVELARLWPGIAAARVLHAAGPHADALLLAGWLRSRLDRPGIELQHEEADELVRVAVDDEPVEPPRADGAGDSELLSDQLDRFDREPVYEQAAAAAT